MHSKLLIMKKITVAIFSVSVFLSSFASAQVQVIVPAPLPHPVIVVAPQPQPVIVVTPRPQPVIVVAPAPVVVKKRKHNHGHGKGHKD
ncbi:MAG: hypothetical protein H0W84_04515 [Bacteroidetes bacterium]|nr:hypothetical protein [Bacteroidota bacterium]